MQDNKNAHVFVHVHAQEVMLADNLRKKKTWNFKESGKRTRWGNGVVKGDMSSTSIVRFIRLLLSQDVALALRAHSSFGKVSSLPEERERTRRRDADWRVDNTRKNHCAVKKVLSKLGSGDPTPAPR